MSVFKRPSASTYSYDFTHRGHRFSGSTGCTDKRAAEAFQKQRREEAKLGAKPPQESSTSGMTFGEAASRFWLERGQYYADDGKSIERSLAWLVKEIGSSTPLLNISDDIVARLTNKRRQERRKHAVKGQNIFLPVANGTVNRTVTEPLRAIVLRAQKVWSQPVRIIQWRLHKLKEPQERVREASVAEEGVILQLLPLDYRPVFQFALLTGCRVAEIAGLRWEHVNFDAREFVVTGKGDKSRTIPLTRATEALLRRENGRHPTAVFSYVVQRTRDGRIRGERSPVTRAGILTCWGRYVRYQVPGFRFHDTRHTAATRLMRATGNIKMTQQLLGHTDIATTSRYTHVTQEDLRQGLEALRTAPNPTAKPHG